MLDYLRDGGSLSERKARLFAAACGRGVWAWMADERARRAVEVGEGYADGRVGRKALGAARRAAFEASKSPAAASPGPVGVTDAGFAAVVALDVCMDARRHDPRELAAGTAGCANGLVFRCEGEAAGWRDLRSQCDLLREVFGNPFRPPSAVDDAVLRWNGGVVRKLAEAAYEERSLPEGTLDAVRLTVLADAVEEAGCPDAELLGHYRGPGRHVRGCWAVDSLLSKG
jgi:hypothetical protein